MKLAAEYRYNMGDPVYLDVGDYKNVPAWVNSQAIGSDGKPFYGVEFEKVPGGMPWGDTLAREDQLVPRRRGEGEQPKPSSRPRRWSKAATYPHVKWDAKAQQWVVVLDGQDVTSFESVQQAANYVQHHTSRRQAPPNP